MPSPGEYWRIRSGHHVYVLKIAGDVCKVAYVFTNPAYGERWLRTADLLAKIEPEDLYQAQYGEQAQAAGAV